jgi:hypothetical protein
LPDEVAGPAPKFRILRIQSDPPLHVDRSRTAQHTLRRRDDRAVVGVVAVPVAGVLAGVYGLANPTEILTAVCFDHDVLVISQQLLTTI